MTDYVERDMSSAILHALADMPVVAVTGMRQTGKSTLLQKQRELEKRRYLTFDDFAHLEAARRSPEGLLEEVEGPVTIDEVHKAPEILTVIKRQVDRKRRAGKFLLSGSANFPMLKGISESLAGRAVYFTLHPFSRRELHGAIGSAPFLSKFMSSPKIPASEFRSVTNEDVLAGGMPPVCLQEVQDKALWFKGYEQTYLERDVRELRNIEDMISFRHLLRLSALRTGQILSVSQLGRDSKMNAVTTSRYLSVLEASFVAWRLSPYLGNRSSRLIKSPKLYFADSGLACHLAGIKHLDSEPSRGAMFETYAAQNLAAILDAGWPEASLHFWNVQGRHEVDFVIEAGKQCLAIEVKAAARWDERDLSGLRAFLSMTPHCTAAILAHNGAAAVKLDRKLWALPLSLVLS
jgi:predicted AAA+ superfamily ATPase